MDSLNMNTKLEFFLSFIYIIIYKYDNILLNSLYFSFFFIKEVNST